METLLPLAVTILIEILLDKSKISKHADKIAKVYVKIKTAAESSPTLAAAIERQQNK